MKTKYNVGDKVTYIGESIPELITKGHVYTILTLGDAFAQIKLDNGVHWAVALGEFELVQDTKKDINVYIYGHPTRGKEVIKMLEERGGINKYNVYTDRTDAIYIINPEDNTITFAENVAIVKVGRTELTLPGSKPKEPEFKLYDRVLVRDNNNEKWVVGLFSHYDSEASDWKYATVGAYYKQCVIFEGNEHLIGTTNKP